MNNIKKVIIDYFDHDLKMLMGMKCQCEKFEPLYKKRPEYGKTLVENFRWPEYFHLCDPIDEVLLFNDEDYFNFLLDKGFQYSGNIYAYAKKSGNVKFKKRFKMYRSSKRKKIKHYSYESGINLCIINGEISKVKEFHKRGIFGNGRSIKLAIEYCQFEMAEYLYQEGYRINLLSHIRSKNGRSARIYKKIRQHQDGI